MLEEIYNTDTPLLSYRKGRSLKDLLVRANLLKVIFLPRPIGAVYMFGLSSHHHFTFNGLGKPVVTVRDFTKFRFPPPLSFELEKISRIFPYPGAENLIHLLVFPTYSPGWPGVLPLGEADDMCIKFWNSALPLFYSSFSLSQHRNLSGVLLDIFYCKLFYRFINHFVSFRFVSFRKIQ